MQYIVVFTAWLALMLAYLVAGSLLIPIEHLRAYKSCPKDRTYYVLNVLWWAVPLAWLLAPSVPWGSNWSIGALSFIYGAVLLIWSRRVNPFFLPILREPQRIVTEGPYRSLRHPGYVGFVAMAVGSWLMLGHWPGVFPLGVYIGFLIVRAHRESRILKLS